jgi:hypothetical protein
MTSPAPGAPGPAQGAPLPPPSAATAQQSGSKAKVTDLLQVPVALTTIAVAVAALDWNVRVFSVITLALAGIALWVQRLQGRPWRTKWMALTLASCIIGIGGLGYSLVPQADSKPPQASTKSPVSIGTNTGQVNIGATVINNDYGSSTAGSDPNPHGPTVSTNSCPVNRTPQRGSIDTLAVDLFVRRYLDGECWDTRAVVGETPSTVELEIRYANTSDAVQKDVEFRISLAPGLYLVPGSTYLKNTIYPTGINLNTDALVSNGVILQSYEPGSVGYVAFEVQTPAIGDLKCGLNVLRTVAYVQPKGLDYFYNTADIDLTRAC